jgi:hypothetical protein
MSATQSACIGVGAVVPETQWEARYVEPQISKLGCLSRYDDHELIRTRVSGDDEVRVYKNGGLKFVGIVIAAVIPIPIGIPMRETITVDWDSGTCTTRAKSTKFSGCMVGTHFEQGFVAQCSGN